MSSSNLVRLTCRINDLTWAEYQPLTSRKTWRTEPYCQMHGFKEVEKRPPECPNGTYCDLECSSLEEMANIGTMCEKPVAVVAIRSSL